MRDLRIVQPHAILDFDRMRREDNFLRFTGPEDYTKVVMVVVNDQVIENVAMYGNDLLAYIPDNLDTADIRYVALVAEETKTSNETTLRFGLGPIPTEVTGTDRLVQLFVKVLLQTPGSDIYHKTVGGGLLRVRKQGAVAGDITVAAADVANAIKKTERDVRALQTGLKMPAAERLIQAEVLRVTPDYSTYDINALVQLRTLAGSRTFFNVAA